MGVALLLMAEALEGTGLPYADQVRIINSDVGYVIVLVTLTWDGFKKN